MIIDFDSEITAMKEIEGRLFVKCAEPIYEVRKNKKGKLYKYSLTKRQNFRARFKQIIEELEKNEQEPLSAQNN